MMVELQLISSCTIFFFLPSDLTLENHPNLQSSTNPCNQDEILIGLSCQVIVPILFKIFFFPNYICLSLYLFVNSTITTLPQFLTLNLGTSLFFLSFSIWIFLIFLLFRLVHYCLIIFHGFFLFFFLFFLFFVGFLWFWRIARNTTQKVLILLLFYYVPFSTIKKKKENKVLHCSMVHCLCCTMLIKQSLEF